MAAKKKISDESTLPVAPKKNKIITLKIMDIRLEDIRFEGDFNGRHYELQARLQMSDSTVDHYAQLYADGTELPPIKVIFDGINYYAWDGIHRFWGHRKLGRKTINCETEPGTLRDAWLKSRGANSSHGLQRDHATIRRVIMDILNDVEFMSASPTDVSIAEICGVSSMHVGNIRRRLQEDRERQAAAKKAAQSGVMVTPTISVIPKQSSPVTGSTTAPMPSHGVGDILDAHGVTIPNGLRRFFRSDKASLEELASEFDKVKSAYNNLILKFHNAGFDETRTLLSKMPKIGLEIDGIISTIKNNLTPYAICPYCKADEEIECSGCGGKRWVIKSEYIAAPGALKNDPLITIRDLRGDDV